jgi:hypothetical protein
MKNNFITACIVLTIMFGSLLVLQHRVDNKFQEDENAINILGQQINDLKKEIFDVRAISRSAISSTELRNAYISIEDNKRFIEYEVKMSKKSIKDFIAKLNEDMSRLNDLVNQSQSNDQSFQEQINFIMQELEEMQISLDSEEPVETIETPKPIEDVRDPIPIETYQQEECNYVLESGKQNKTTVIQKAVNKVRRKGNYKLQVFFDVNEQNNAVISNVNSNNAPSRLEKAVQSYVSQLKFVAKDSLQSNCEMSFNLNVT